MATLQEALTTALHLHQAGRLQEAEQIYRQVLQAFPQQAEAWHLLGLVAHQTGRAKEAVESIGRAIAIKPGAVVFHSNLALAQRAAGDLEAAVASGRRAIELDPRNAEACCNLGSVLSDLRRLDEAAEVLRRALELRPRYPEARYNLANALREQGRAEEALAEYRQVVQENPDFLDAWANQGFLLRELGRPAEAIACYQQVVRRSPGYYAIYFAQGNALADLGKTEEAAASYRLALEIQPLYPDASNNLGNALKELGRYEEAMACYRQVEKLRPLNAGIQNNLASVYKLQGLLVDALAHYQRGLTIEPGSVDCRSSLLFFLHYCPAVKPAELAENHAEWDRRHGLPLRAQWRPPLVDRDPHRRLRLGFVSCDLGRHPVGRFLLPAFERLDRRQCEAYCYSGRELQDSFAPRFAAGSAAWRKVASWSDQRLAEQIRDDRVDVLFDLAGHTSGSRLLTFARRPAPVQITWIGYEGTTGLSAMDYLLADRYVAPEGAERYHAERLLRMPDAYVCYEPPDDAPPPGPLPAESLGRVTFGSFNNLAKLNDEVLGVWAEILRRVPGARLVLKYRGLDDPATVERFAARCQAAGLARERLELLGWTPYRESLAAHQPVDIALDPFPFSGSATTCDALWMGVPVVTCPGETFASRHTLTHLSNVGLTETIARDLREYVDLAVRLAGDRPRLASIRAGLRQQMAASPLCDGQRFAAALMERLRGAWRSWCAGLEPPSG